VPSFVPCFALEISVLMQKCIGIRKDLVTNSPISMAGMLLV
jgi:hypothetical protein